MAVRQRRRFQSVRVVANDHSHGRVLGLQTTAWFRPTLSRESRLRRILEEDILIFLAGPLAEARFGGAHDLSQVKHRAMPGATYDVQIIDELAGYMSASTDEVEAFLNWLAIHAWNWINDDTWWCSVERLADQLLLAHTLRYREAQRLIITTRLRHIQDAAQARRGNPPMPALR
jgi:hypothetical protein